jgi:hypothetical protein
MFVDGLKRVRIQFSKTALDYAMEEDRHDVECLIEVRLSTCAFDFKISASECHFECEHVIS